MNSLFFSVKLTLNNLRHYFLTAIFHITGPRYCFDSFLSLHCDFRRGFVACGSFGHVSEIDLLLHECVQSLLHLRLFAQLQEAICEANGQEDLMFGMLT